MRILVACEFSGIVRDAFASKGHYAMSCDLEPTESSGIHYQGDVMDILYKDWDMMIAHPPCTFLTTTANRHFKNNPERWQSRVDAMIFVKKLLDAPIPKICLENPKGVISSFIRPPDQYIHPFHFGDRMAKLTGLWLKGLPPLMHTKIVQPEVHLYKSKKTKSGFSKYSKLGKLGKNHGKERSVFFPGIAQAMAEQWG